MKRINFIRRTIHFSILVFLLLTSQSFAQKGSDYDPLIEKYSSQYGVDKNLVKSLIQVSSGGNPKAVSSSGAVGLMQLTPDLSKNLGIRNPYDPEENIKGGCSYLKSLMSQFSEIELAVAAFNAGSNEVQKYGKVPPYAETKRFVEAVMNKYKSLKDSESKLKIFGKWAGTARYTKYVSTPPLNINIVGTTQPFDLEITPHGSGVSLKTSRGSLGDPSLYTNVQLDDDILHVEYNGPNPFGQPIPNTKTTHTMSYVLDVSFKDGSMKGVYYSTVKTKMVFLNKDLNIPDSEAEINYSMDLNLKRK